ncbi:FxsA family protein [Methylopila sp. 73B]|uniref:FxsA family protein n=1 Tax=Methylopila sp. 73B TaxID=1120792 RepID=UPI0003719B2D|nr:FxsA family protein [Methylopila sp. 73B]
MPRLLTLFLALPILEIVAFALVAAIIGVGKAILLQVAISAIGIAMLGSLVTEAKTEARRRGGLVSFAMDGSKGLRGLAGLLFAIPGFITDVIGVLALVPEFRTRIRRFLGWAEVAPATVHPQTARPARKEMLDLDQAEWREVEPARRPER